MRFHNALGDETSSRRRPRKGGNRLPRGRLPSEVQLRRGRRDCSHPKIITVAWAGRTKGRCRRVEEDAATRAVLENDFRKVGLPFCCAMSSPRISGATREVRKTPDTLIPSAATRASFGIAKAPIISQAGLTGAVCCGLKTRAPRFR